MSSNPNFTHRYQAVIRICAESPLCVGTGQGDFNTDDKIARDAFGIPYIPGTGLTGALRASLTKARCAAKNVLTEGLTKPDDEQCKGKDKMWDFFGKESQGSRLMVSSAHLLIKGKVADGLDNIEDCLSAIEAQILPHLALREHVRINEKGVAADKGKFELEYLAKGVEMVFELELLSNKEEKDCIFWNNLLKELQQPWFRIGGNTRKGFGQLGIKAIYTRCLDLTDTTQRQAYLDKCSKIKLPEVGKDFWEKLGLSKPENSQDYRHYPLKLKARDFFLFDGFNLDLFKDNKEPSHKPADFHPKQERVLVYDEKEGKYKDNKLKYLIPASSIKGALRHRFAYHYNCILGDFIQADSFNTNLEHIEQQIKALEDKKAKLLDDFQAELDSKTESEINKLNLEQAFAKYEAEINKIEAQLSHLIAFSTDNLGKLPNAKEDFLAAYNQGVKHLFGYALDTKDKEQDQGQKGRLLIHDLYIDVGQAKKKVLNHVKIDRFTGGAIDTALFTEEVLEYNEELRFDFYIEKEAFEDKKIEKNGKSLGKNIEAAWDKTLKDLRTSRLALGGGSLRGHGMFEGELD